MNIELYQYGLNMRLDSAVRILRSALGKKLSKRDKDVRISEAIGIIETASVMVDVTEPEEKQEEVLIWT